MQSTHDDEVLDLLRFSSPTECPICRAAALRKIGEVPTIHPRSTLQVSVLRCQACGHWFSSPRPEQAYLSELYASGSLSVLGEGWASCTAEQTQNSPAPAAGAGEYQHWILEDENAALPGNYLEIGPGDCHLLQAFRRRGWNAWGVEPGDWGAGIAQTVRHIDALPSQISFDVVVIHDVLEHLSEPGDVIKQVSGKIARDGRLYLAFPNVDSVEAMVLKTRWSMVRPIGHLHYFSGKSLRHLLQENGFCVSYAKKANVGASWNVVRTAARAVVFDGRIRGLLTIAKFLIKRTLDALRIGDQWRVRAVRRDAHG